MFVDLSASYARAVRLGLPPHAVLVAVRFHLVRRRLACSTTGTTPDRTRPANELHSHARPRFNLFPATRKATG